MIAADFNCIGDHGIGRFAKEIFKRLDFQPLKVDANPSSPSYTYFLMKALSRGSSTSFFSPSYIPPLWAKIPFIFTIHDLNHIDRSENSSTAKRIYYQTILKSGCRRAVKVLTVSEFSRQRILDWTGVDASKVVNVGNGVDPSFTSFGDIHNPGYPYFLCVSNRRGHKNEARLIDSYAASTAAKHYKLVLTGNPTPHLIRIVEMHNMRERVVFAGTVLEESLPALYRGATALVFPSLYEGFGLPVVEAMACGTPVITSNVTALPEVAGGAAVLVDPLNSEEISGAIDRIAKDVALRDHLRNLGVERAKLFSWDLVAGRIKRELDLMSTDQT